MIEGYLNKRAVWKRKTGSNEYGEPSTSSKSIKVRWEGKLRLVRSKDGREVVSEARVFCVEAVQAGDELEHGGRRWPVIAVSTVPGLDGAENHREVAV